MKWLAMLFGSVRAEKGMKPSVSEGGNSVEAKLVKKNEIPKRGQFNIMVSYSNENVLTKKGEGKKIFLIQTI